MSNIVTGGRGAIAVTAAVLVVVAGFSPGVAVGNEGRASASAVTAGASDRLGPSVEGPGAASRIDGGGPGGSAREDADATNRTDDAGGGPSAGSDWTDARDRSLASASVDDPPVEASSVGLGSFDAPAGASRGGGRALDDGSTLSGYVTDARTGEPVEDAVVIAANDSAATDVRTGAGGGYRLSVAPGEYDTWTCAAGYLPNVTDETVDGEYERHDVALEPFVGDTVDVGGVVSDVQTNVPIEDATVRVVPETVVLSGGRVNFSAGESIDPDLRDRLEAAADRRGACGDQAQRYLDVLDDDGKTLTPGPNGQFGLPNLPSGRYVVTVDAPTHRQQRVTLPREGTGEIESSRALRVYLLGRNVTANGTVYGYKPTDDGRERVELGKFDVNATVLVDGEAAFGPFHDGYVATPNESPTGGDEFELGYYEFEDVPTGEGIANSSYRVSAWSMGYERTTKRFPTTPAGETDFTLDYDASSLTVAVESPAYEDGAGEHLPIEGARVRLVGKPGDTEGDNVPATDGVELTGRVDAEGEVTFDDLPPGRYTVVVEDRELTDGDVLAEFPGRQSIVRVDPNESATAEIDLWPAEGRVDGRLLTLDDPVLAPAIAGEKRFPGGGDGEGPNESRHGFTRRPLADASVSVADGSFRGYRVDESFESAESEATGAFARVVPPAQYDFRASKAGFVDETLSVGVSSDAVTTENATVRPAEDYFYGVVVMGIEGFRSDHELINPRGPASVATPGVHLEGTSFVSQGGGFDVLRGARVRFENGSHAFVRTTNGSGHFRLFGVPEGDYTVTVEHPDLGPDPVEVPESLVSDGAGNLDSVVVTAEPAETRTVEVTYVSDPDCCPPDERSRRYTLNATDGSTKLLALSAVDGSPVQELPAERSYAVLIPDGTDEGPVYPNLGYTTDATSFSFTDDPSVRDSGDTTTQRRIFAGHVYARQNWHPLEDADVTLQKNRTGVRAGWETVGSATTGPNGSYHIQSPITGPGPIARHRVVVNHPTINRTTEETFGRAPAMTVEDVYPEKEFREVRLRIVDGDGDPVTDARVVLQGPELQTRPSGILSPNDEGVVRVGVRTPFVGRMSVSVGGGGYYPANATTTRLEIREPFGDPIRLGTVTTQRIPAPNVELRRLEWRSGGDVGFNTHVLSGVTDPDSPSITEARVAVETNRVAGTSEPEVTASGPKFASARPAFAPEVDYRTWLRRNDPVGEVRVAFVQQNESEDARVLFRQLDTDDPAAGGDATREWTTTVDLSELPPTHFTRSEDVDTHRLVTRPIDLQVNATTEKGSQANHSETLSDDRIYVNRPPSLYGWIYEMTGGADSELPIPGDRTAASTRGLKIPSPARAGAGFGTDQRIEQTVGDRLNYSIEQGAMFDFGWFGSPDSLKQLTTASEQWGVKAEAETSSGVTAGGQATESVDGQVSVNVGLPDDAFSVSPVSGSVEGSVDVDVDNAYQLPPARGYSANGVARGRMTIQGKLITTYKVDVIGAAATGLLGGNVGVTKATDVLADIGAVSLSAKLSGGPNVTVEMEIDERLFPYDFRVQDWERITVGADYAGAVTGTAGFGAASGEAHLNASPTLSLAIERGGIDPEYGELRAGFGGSFSILGYEIVSEGTEGVLVRQEFDTAGRVYVLSRERTAGTDRNYTDRSDYARFRGDGGVLVAEEYRFAGPAVTTSDGNATYLYVHDDGEESPPASFEARVSDAPGRDSPRSPTTIREDGVVDADLTTTDGATVAAVSSVVGSPTASYPPAYLDDAEISVLVREDGSGTDGDAWRSLRVTDDERVDVQPRAHGEWVVWTTDRDGVVTTFEDRRIRAARLDGGSVTGPQVVADVPVVDKAVGGPGPTVAVLTDADDDQYTSDDREVIRLTREGGTWDRTRLTDDDATQAHPAVAGDVVGWVRRGFPDELVAHEGGGTTTVATARGIQGADGGTLDGHPVLAWAAREAGADRTVLRASLRAGGEWRAPVELGRVDANVSDVRAAVDGRTGEVVVTYTVPGNVTDTRTVGYRSGGIGHLAVEDGTARAVGIAVAPESGVDAGDEEVPVAFLGGEDFDAVAVDGRVESARLGRYAVLAGGGGASPHVHEDASGIGHVRDADGDGVPDLVVHFEMPAELGSNGSTVTAVLTTNDTTYAGSDAIDLGVGLLERVDANDNGSIDDPELRDAIVAWSMGEYTDEQLRTIIVAWSRGTIDPALGPAPVPGTGVDPARFVDPVPSVDPA